MRRKTSVFIHTLCVTFRRRHSIWHIPVSSYWRIITYTQSRSALGLILRIYIEALYQVIQFYFGLKIGQLTWSSNHKYHLWCIIHYSQKVSIVRYASMLHTVLQHVFFIICVLVSVVWMHPVACTCSITHILILSIMHVIFLLAILNIILVVGFSLTLH